MVYSNKEQAFNKRFILFSVGSHYQVNWPAAWNLNQEDCRNDHDDSVFLERSSGRKTQSRTKRKLPLFDQREIPTEPFKPLLCLLCPYRTSRSGDLKKHMQCIHSQTRNFSCDFCGQKFKMASSLYRHEREACIKWKSSN